MQHHIGKYVLLYFFIFISLLAISHSQCTSDITKKPWSRYTPLITCTIFSILFSSSITYIKCVDVGAATAIVMQCTISFLDFFFTDFPCVRQNLMVKRDVDQWFHHTLWVQHTWDNMVAAATTDITQSLMVYDGGTQSTCLYFSLYVQTLHLQLLS